jgi:hypothetical protein
MFLSACVFMMAACGPSGERRADDTTAAQESATADDGAARDHTPAVVEPVAVEVLQSAFPRIDGWQQSATTGERLLVPVPFAQAEADYSNGEATITVKLVDTAFNEVLVAPWAMFLQEGHEARHGDGYERALTVAGHPAFERMSRTDRRGELNVVVRQRFLVSVEGDNVDDTKLLHVFATSIDTSKWPRE